MNANKKTHPMKDVTTWCSDWWGAWTNELASRFFLSTHMCALHTGTASTSNSVQGAEHPAFCQSHTVDILGAFPMLVECRTDREHRRVLRSLSACCKMCWMFECLVFGVPVLLQSWLLWMSEGHPCVVKPLHFAGQSVRQCIELFVFCSLPTRRCPNRLAMNTFPWFCVEAVNRNSDKFFRILVFACHCVVVIWSLDVEVHGWLCSVLFLIICLFLRGFLFLMVFKNIRVPLFSNELPHTFFMFSWWIGTSSLVLDYINQTHWLYFTFLASIVSVVVFVLVLGKVVISWEMMFRLESFLMWSRFFVHDQTQMAVYP